MLVQESNIHLPWLVVVFAVGLVYTQLKTGDTKPIRDQEVYFDNLRDNDYSYMFCKLGHNGHQNRPELFSVIIGKNYHATWEL